MSLPSASARSMSAVSSASAESGMVPLSSPLWKSMRSAEVAI
ncbi:hypothetical protein [Cloacibacillus sp.]|nr:hypothetical protein [Cloacibacillus sp.]